MAARSHRPASADDSPLGRRIAQYTCIRFTETLALEGLSASIETVGDAHDNAVAESVFGLSKNEAIATGSAFRTGPLRTLADVEAITTDYIDWYNNHRLHSLLAAIPGAIISALFSCVLLAAFLTQVGELQTAPILISVVTAYLAIEAVKYLLARLKCSKEQTAKEQAATTRPEHPRKRRRERHICSPGFSCPVRISRRLAAKAARVAMMQASGWRPLLPPSAGHWLSPDPESRSTAEADSQPGQSSGGANDQD